MKRFITKRLLSLTNSLRSPHCFSQLAQNQTPLPENEVPVPKLPQFDYSPPPYVGPPADEILAKRKEYLSPSLFHFFNEPLNVVDGKMQYLFDENGRRYLDGFRGIATVCCGHCHPDVVDAIVKQINRIQHSTVLYLNHAIADFAEALASKMPGNLKVVFLTNSRTEANELALMIARLYTGCQDIISLTNAYHGNAAATMGATAQSIWKFNVIQSGIHHALNPDPYRGVFGSDGEKYVKDVQDVIDFGTTGHVAGFISEVIQGVGGIIELAPGYLPASYGSVDKAGGLCITDEVQAGFGRTGSHFWGFETQGVVPDIVTMAKGIGNGIPLGAVVTTPEIAEVLTRRSYFNTFGGNPLCAAAGLAVLKVVEKENLQENALAGGSYLKKRLTELQDKYESLQEEEKKKTHGDANELVSDGGFEMPEKNAFGQSFRDYNNADSERQEIVKRTYRLQHINQTYDFVKKMREEYGKLDKAKMSIWECCELLNDVVDDSDPDLDEPQIMHLLQSAEAIRKDYPDEDWLHLTALIHDLGKILLLPQFGQLPQWAVVGDIFPVGCAFDESNVHYKYFEENPDYNNPNYNTKNGVYPQGCGLNNVLMSFGHDDYMYLVAKENGPTLPSAALFIIRYHSLYPLHKCGAYEHLMNGEDKENLKWLKIFNKYDLYSKSKVPIDVEDVKPYYLSLSEKYFPAKLRW